MVSKGWDGGVTQPRPAAHIRQARGVIADDGRAIPGGGVRDAPHNIANIIAEGERDHRQNGQQAERAVRHAGRGGRADGEQKAEQLEGYDEPHIRAALLGVPGAERHIVLPFGRVQCGNADVVGAGARVLRQVLWEESLVSGEPARAEVGSAVTHNRWSAKAEERNKWAWSSSAAAVPRTLRKE